MPGETGFFRLENEDRLVKHADPGILFPLGNPETWFLNYN